MTQTHTPSLSAQLADQVEAASALLIGVQIGRRQGTALVLDGDRRWLITAAHLLHPPHRRPPHSSVVHLFLPDGTTGTATVKGVDRSLDVAVLAVEDAALVLPSAPDWGEVSSAPLVRLGELVVTAGREGAAGVRVTLGVVSALRGAWRTPGGATVARWLEVDAALPAPSSGGLLLNLAGKAVGWNTHGLTRVGAVLPLAQVQAAALLAAEAGTTSIGRGVLGVGVQPARLPDGRRGLLVHTLEPDAPALRAGVLVGDVLTHLEGMALQHPTELLHALAGRAEQSVTLTLLRGGVEQTLSITPAAHRPRAADRQRCGPWGWGRGWGGRGGEESRSSGEE